MNCYSYKIYCFYVCSYMFIFIGYMFTVVLMRRLKQMYEYDIR